MIGLTRRQRDLLDFIGAYMATENVAPSFEEMKEGIGLKSKSGIHRLLAGLEERGFVARIPDRARALEVLETPRAVLTTAKSRPLISESTDDLLAELRARGLDIVNLGEFAA